MSRKGEKPVVFSALEVANICGVVNQTAINWIRSGFLKAYTTPGGQFRVYPDDLADFMLKRKMRLPDELLAVCSNGKKEIKTLLVVDDDKGLNTVIAKYIEKQIDSLTIYQAFDGFDAGSQMVEKHPDCVILDLDLPGVDGFDLCRRVHEREIFGKPIIIVVTALEDSDAENRVKEFGVKQFLKKPLNLAELVDTVKSLL